MSVSTNRAGVDVGWIAGILLFLFLIWLAIMALRFGPAILDKIACCLCSNIFTPLEKKLLEDLEKRPCWISNPVQFLTGLKPMLIPVQIIPATSRNIRMGRPGAPLSW